MAWTADDDRRDLLRLTLTPGLGPTLLRRALDTFGSAKEVLGASETGLRNIRGVGVEKARTIRRAMHDSDEAADRELELVDKLGVHLVTMLDEQYPPLLNEIGDAPLVLYVRGELDPDADRYAVAIVGSRSCSHYGREQAGRFAALLSQSGLPIVSGGARGIDTSAHQGALRVNGRTIVVMGCGLASCYPPENDRLFAQVAEQGGAVVSELPLQTPPVAENFPARNRIISGMSLGTLVIEAGRRSGALITARLAAEEHGREVMAIPGRVDSRASEGSLELIKSGGAALVCSPGDVLSMLESPARHAHRGVHEARFADPTKEPAGGEQEGVLFDRAIPQELTVSQRTIIEALAEPCTLAELERQTGLTPSAIRSDATLLEIRQVVVRQGDRLARRTS